MNCTQDSTIRKTEQIKLAVLYRGVVFDRLRHDDFSSMIRILRYNEGVMTKVNFNGRCKMLRGNEREKADKRLIYILYSDVFYVALSCLAILRLIYYYNLHLIISSVFYALCVTMPYILLGHNLYTTSTSYGLCLIIHVPTLSVTLGKEVAVLSKTTS